MVRACSRPRAARARCGASPDAPSPPPPPRRPQADATPAAVLPALSAPVDVLRGGAISFKQTSLALHPVEAIQRAAVAGEWEAALAAQAKAFGAHAALERRLDAAALAAVERLPGGPASSHALLDTYLGRDGKMGFEDSLGGERGGRRGSSGAQARECAVPNPPPSSCASRQTPSTTRA